MIRKYHNHTLKTNPRHRKEEPHNIYSNKTSKRQLKQSKQLFLFLAKMIAKLERTHSNEYQNQDQHRNLQTMGGYIKQKISNNRATTLERTEA